MTAARKERRSFRSEQILQILHFTGRQDDVVEVADHRDVSGIRNVILDALQAGPEQQLFQKVRDALPDDLFATIDIHNNTGKNPSLGYASLPKRSWYNDERERAGCLSLC